MPKHRVSSRTASGRAQPSVAAYHRGNRSPRSHSSAADDYPLATADPDLSGSVVEMRQQNEERLRNALEQVAPRPPRVQHPHHVGHAVSAPNLSYGMDNPFKAGSYYQKVGTQIIPKFYFY